MKSKFKMETGISK